MRNIVAVSGGKDSVALWLWARRTGLDPVAVYTDTHWEWDEADRLGQTHYTHLAMLEARLGKIHRVDDGESFADTVRRKRSFPSRVRKWCTEEKKLNPFRAWLDRFRDETGDDVRVLVGIRREESAKRADPEQTPEREWSGFYDCEVWRPILDWTVEEVILEHRAVGIPMHPLYHHGAERVGCFPCVNASKAELRVVGELGPKRIDEIRALEAEMGATMFTEDVRTEKKRIARALEAQGLTKEEAWEKAGPSVRPIGIDAVMVWAKTERGGQQLALVKPRTGCARWGVCERPS